VLTESYGCASCEKQVPATPKTIYRIGSVSKTMTATVLAILAEEGVLSLDDPVSKYVPEFIGLIDPKNHARKITLRHLANHTSGLAREPQMTDAAKGPINLWQLKLLDAIPTTKLEGNPGSQYVYSNIGFGILGLAISRAANEPFMKLVETRLFNRLNMSSSTFILSENQIGYVATGYDNAKDIRKIDLSKPAIEHQGRGYKVPNGGVYSTVGDLAKYVIALMGKSDDFSDALRVELYKRPKGITNDDGRGLEAYGLGIRMHVTQDGEVLSANHGGTVSGYRTWIQFDPKGGHAVILLRNYNKGANELSLIADEFLAELLPTLNKM
jgi:CubicO group peptidase (beta-lactamase class C family)